MCGSPRNYARSTDSTLVTSTSSCLPPNPPPCLTALLPCLCQDAVFEAPDPSKEPGTVMHVAAPGYVLHERSLRAASVGVVKKA